MPPVRLEPVALRSRTKHYRLELDQSLITERIEIMLITEHIIIMWAVSSRGIRVYWREREKERERAAPSSLIV